MDQDMVKSEALTSTSCIRLEREHFWIKTIRKFYHNGFNEHYKKMNGYKTIEKLFSQFLVGDKESLAMEGLGIVSI